MLDRTARGVVVAGAQIAGETAVEVVVGPAIADNPAVFAVGAPEAKFDLERLLRGKDTSKSLAPERAIVRLHPREPSFAKFRLSRPAGEVEPRLVQVVACTGGVGSPDQIREPGEQREVEVPRAFGLLSELDAVRRVAGDDRIAL